MAAGLCLGASGTVADTITVVAGITVRTASSLSLDISFREIIHQTSDATDRTTTAWRWRNLRNALVAHYATPMFAHTSRDPARAVAVSRDHAMELKLLCKDPRIVAVANFLSPSEAQCIVQMAKDATWLGNAAAGEEQRRVSGRTNRWCCIGHESPVLERVVERACLLTGLTPAHAEELQVVHYLPGQQYELHVDHYTDRDVKDAATLQPNGGNRLISMFVYLTGCEAGGHTAFPLAGVRMAPQCGHALLWHNIDKHGLLDGRTLHSGEPVERGCKWGMNIWLRQRPRRSAASADADQDSGRRGDGGSRVGCWPRVGAPPLSATTPKSREASTLRERN